MKITEPASFPEIWEKLDSYQRREIICAVIGTGATANPQTVKNWAMGKNRPPVLLVREAVAATVSNVLGVNIPSKILFS
jgi:hypothetical protein